MDKIAKSLVDDFLKLHEIKSEGIEKDFEKFANYSIISKEFNRSFDVDDTLTGDDDTGIDGIAIIVNGQLVQKKEEIDFLIENNNFLEVTFIFIESKTSKHFKKSEINNFAFGVKDFFDEQPHLIRNTEIQNFAEIINYLFDHASLFRENPKCKLYFVTNGNWTGDKNCLGVVHSTMKYLTETNYFSDLFFNLIDAKNIAKIYRNTKNTIQTTFVFQDKVALPDLPNIKEAYYGILPMSEFKKILLDENGNMRSIFFDNIRDFQGIDNPVNTSIEDTLESDNPELFTVLNNGITVVATSLGLSGKNFTISDYQIVNGCQTSNVLYNHIKTVTLDNLSVPIKLIITDMDDVKNRITIATNSQTAVKREQLQAVTEFQKTLEYYFETTEGDEKLYYERRPGQYQSDSSIVKSRVINIQNLIKAFSSIFYENPDRVTTYFGSIVKQSIENEDPAIFNTEHQNLPYYTSALAFYRLDFLFRSKQIDKRYKKIKFFILMLFRKLVNENNLDRIFLNSERKVNEYCQPIVDILKDKNLTLHYFKKATEIVDFSKLNIEDKQLIKQRDFTRKLNEAFKEFKKQDTLF